MGPIGTVSAQQNRPPELIAAVMPMNTLERARHLNSSASAPIQKVITPCPITIALFTSVLSLSNIIGLLRRWTMDFASRLLSKMSKPAGFSGGAQNSSARA